MRSASVINDVSDAEGLDHSALVAVEPGAVAFFRGCMITIVTPSYNSEGFINKQYARFRDLLSDEIQWIIIDDASTDNTEIIVKNFDNKNITYHKLNKNSGPAIARHKGVELSKTELIFFLDADDILLEENFKALLEYITSHRCSRYNFFYTPSYTSNHEPNLAEIKFKKENEEQTVKSALDYIKYGMPNFSSLVIRRKYFLENIPSNSLPWGEDIATYLQLVNNGTGLKWILPVSCYVITGDGRGSRLSFKNRLKLFKFLLTYSAKSPGKPGNMIFSVFIIFRSVASYIYKTLRG